MHKWRIFSILLSIFLLIVFLFPYTGRMNERVELSDSLSDTLRKMGNQAALKGDVPVAAVLTLDELIIGTGYNDVISGNHAGGHAELNALSAALKKYGARDFKKLDRSKLRLITTYEPCGMCRAALAEYRIHDIRVVKYKSLWMYWKEWIQSQRVLFNSQPAGKTALQDSLFELHPGFKKENLSE